MATLDQTYAPIVIRDRDDIGSNRSSNQPLLELHKARMSRRAALKGLAAAPLGASRLLGSRNRLSSSTLAGRAYRPWQVARTAGESAGGGFWGPVALSAGGRFGAAGRGADTQLADAR